jgi:hypothetical protein
MSGMACSLCQGRLRQLGRQWKQIHLIAESGMIVHDNGRRFDKELLKMICVTASAQTRYTPLATPCTVRATTAFSIAHSVWATKYLGRSLRIAPAWHAEQSTLRLQSVAEAPLETRLFPPPANDVQPHLVLAPSLPLQDPL